MKPTMTDEERRAAKAAYMRAYYEAHPEKFRSYEEKRDKAQRAAYNRAYHADPANKVRIKEKARAWRQKNADKVAASRKAYKAANPDKIRAASKKYYWATKETRKEAMRANALKQNRKRPALLLARQEAALGRKKPDACEACGGNDGGIVFDHCHERMHPRGWICDRCNVALGCLRDDIDRLRKLIVYLERNANGVTPEFMIAGKFASRYRHTGSRRHVVVASADDDSMPFLTRIG